jgi:hypothetical protein
MGREQPLGHSRVQKKLICEMLGNAPHVHLEINTRILHKQGQNDLTDSVFLWVDSQGFNGNEWQHSWALSDRIDPLNREFEQRNQPQSIQFGTGSTYKSKSRRCHVSIVNKLPQID